MERLEDYIEINSFQTADTSHNTLDKEYVMKKGDTVMVKCFFGTKTPNEPTEDQYNYWKLIGSLGTIIETREKHSFYPEKGKQALVQFDNLDNLQLMTHNKAPNSLWCFVSDLSSQY